MDYLRQKGGEKQARSKQRMYSPIEGRMRTPHRRRFPHPRLQAAEDQVVGWKVFIEKPRDEQHRTAVADCDAPSAKQTAVADMQRCAKYLQCQGKSWQ